MIWTGHSKATGTVKETQSTACSDKWLLRKTDSHPKCYRITFKSRSGSEAFACLLLYGTRGFVYKTFCVDSRGNEGGETVGERELKWESHNLQSRKSLEIYVNVYHSSSNPHLKREHSDNKSSPYKWMGCWEPFELSLICLVAFKRRDPPQLVYVRGLSEVHWHSTRC